MTEAIDAETGERMYVFTRDQLIEAVSRLEAYPAKLKSGRVVIMAESMANAIIEALEDGNDGA